MPPQASSTDVPQDHDVATLEYRDSHNDLLWPIWSRPTAGDAPACELGAVVVPTCRHLTDELPGLRLAAELALHYDCPLLVVLSKAAVPEDFPGDLAKRLDGRLTVVELNKVPVGWRPGLESARHPLSRLKRNNDVGPKRNLGLSLGVASGWDTVLFIDDDITALAEGHTLSPGTVDHSLRMMHARAELKAVGWAAESFPDNSMVGHTRRLVGLTQDVFVGGGAQLIRCEPGVPFSPDIYNEDWLQTLCLLLAQGAAGRSVGFGGHVSQLAYDPHQPRRAASEEAGDLIAEALMNVFENGALVSPAGLSESFWRAAIRVRRRLIRDLLQRLAEMGLPEPEHGRIADALHVALGVNAILRAADVKHYLQVLDQDRQRWADHLSVISGQAHGRDNVPSPEVPLKDLADGRSPSWLTQKTLRLSNGQGRIR